MGNIRIPRPFGFAAVDYRCFNEAEVRMVQGFTIAVLLQGLVSQTVGIRAHWSGKRHVDPSCIAIKKKASSRATYPFIAITLEPTATARISCFERRKLGPPTPFET